VYNDNPESNSSVASRGGTITLLPDMVASTAAGPAPSFIATMDTFTVERVELLKGPRAAIYGSRGANGVILIYTNKGVGQKRRAVLAPDFTIPGHAAERVFYSPKYDVKIDAHNTADYRATLYWNPSVTTDEEGNATIEFFNSDTVKKIQLSIEGLSPDGIPGTYLETIGESE
jgi:TonB-dependent SusC/RagA subfamily outer membrane receptor